MDDEATPYALAPVTYGVWIRGLGWLKKERRVFSDPRVEVARTAARLWGDGASVLPVDESLVDLEVIFLERERVKRKRVLGVLWPI